MKARADVPVNELPGQRGGVMRGLPAGMAAVEEMAPGRQGAMAALAKPVEIPACMAMLGSAGKPNLPTVRTKTTAIALRANPIL